MSLDLSRLENVHQRGDRTLARCPACAEQDHDKRGHHLVIMPDGRFGCVANPGAAGKSHRQRIFALAGDVNSRRRGAFMVRVRRPSHATSAQPAVNVVDLGRLGRVETTPAPCVNHGPVCGDMTLPKIADATDTPGRPGRVFPTLALRENQDIIDDGETEKESIYTRSIGRNPSGASGVSDEMADYRKSRQATPTAQDIDPETGFPIIGGAVCPF